MEKNNRLWKRMLALGLMMIMVFMLGACGSKEKPSKDSGSDISAPGESSQSASTAEKVINRGIIGAPGSLNPLVDAGGAQFIVLEMIFDRPFDFGSDGTCYPRLCDSYEVNEEYTEYILHLNKDAKWTDGEDVTAEDFVWTYKMYTDPEVGTTHAAKLAALSGVDDKTGLQTGSGEFGVSAVDEDTVKFSLTQSRFPHELFNGYLYIFPEHVYGGEEPSRLLTSDIWLHPVGSSYCMLDTYIDGSVYEFKANKNYYLGAPDFDKMVVKCMESTNLLSALMSGEIDMTVGHANRGNIPTADVEMAKKQSNLTLEASGTSIQYLTINNQKYDKNIRKAIDLAIDKEMIANQVFLGYAEVMNQLFPPSTLHYNKDLPPFQRDVEEAKRLLAEAGWDESRKLELLVTSTDSELQSAAVIIQQNLADVGIHVEIVSMEYASLLDQCRGSGEGNYDLAIIGTAFGFEPASFKTNVMVGGATNFYYSDDAYYYNAFDQAGKELDYDKRHQIFCDLQEYYLDNVPAAYLVNKQSVFCYNNEVVAECDLTNAADMVWRMWEWKFNK